MSNMTKFAEKMLSEATAALNNIKQTIASGTIDVGNYLSLRKAFNRPILGLCLGADIDLSGEKNKCRFNHPLPSRAEINAAVSLVRELRNDYEIPLIQEAAKAGKNIEVIGQVPVYSKINIREIKDAIVGTGNTATPIIGIMFDEFQVLEIAALAEDIKKKVDTNNALIIGGIVLAVTAIAVGTGVYIYNKKKKAEELELLDSDDVGYIDDVDDDLPHVEISDEVLAMA